LTSQLCCLTPTENSRSSRVIESQYYGPVSGARETTIQRAINLVYHHDCEKIADGGEKETIEVVLHLVADGVTKDVQDNLADDEEEDAKGNVTNRPAVFQRTHDEDDLADSVHEEEDGVDNVRDNEDADGVVGAQARPVLEGEQRNGAANDKHAEGGEP
jgi:hypothetical protein